MLNAKKTQLDFDVSNNAFLSSTTAISCSKDVVLVQVNILTWTCWLMDMATPSSESSNVRKEQI